MKSSDVLNLLQEQPPTTEKLAEETKNFDHIVVGKWPVEGSQIENAILSCCVAIFLNQDTESCQERLKTVLSAELYNHLTLFLAYNKTALTWA